MLLNGAELNQVELNGGQRRLARQTIVVSIPASSRWRLRVLLDGVDFSARITGMVTIDREEGAARVLRLALLPTAGELDLDLFTGKTLELYRQRIEAGAVVAEQLRFTGATQRPRFNATSLVISITATCERQNRVELMTIEQINALVPGYWALGVFDEITSRWKYAQERCSTLPASLETSVNGNLRINQWAPAATAHFSFGPSSVVDGSIEIEPADAGQIVNMIEVVLQYRYTRLRHREHSYVWDHPFGNFCAWLADSTELPTLSMLLDAIEQADWDLIGAPFTDKLPETSENPCGTGIPWRNDFTADPHLLGFAVNVARRTAQTLTEQYTLTLRAEGSIAAFGERPSRESYSDEIDYDSRSWETLPADQRPAEAVEDAVGDWIVDKEEAGRRDNLLITALQREFVRMVASHRQTRLMFKTPITDAVYDTNHTATVQVYGTRAKGKVTRVTEVYDLDNGTEVATVELAIRRGGAAVDSSPLVLPARPAFDLGTPPTSSTTLATQIGGRIESPPLDEELDGFAGNYAASFEGTELYPRRLQITTPDIEATHRDPAEAQAASTYTIGLVSDELVTEVA